MLQVVARIISVVFHPLAVIMAFAMFYITNLYDHEMALLVMWLIGLIAVLPIVVYNSIQLFRGKISNFDLSNQQQRNKVVSFTDFDFGIACFKCYLDEHS